MAWTEESAVTTNWLYSADKVYLILHTGQSLSIGGGDNSIVSVATRYPNYCQMLADGTRGFGSFAFLDTWEQADISAYAAQKLIEDAPDFVPIAEESGITRGETQGSGLLEQLHKLDEADVPDKVYVYRSHGRAGALMSEIEKPRPPYLIGLEEVRRVKDIAATYGKEAVVLAVFITHGEADRDNASYGTNFAQLAADYQADIPGITGQSEDVLVIFDQTAPARNDGLQTVIQEIQIAQHVPGNNVFLSTPKYHLPYADDVHLTAAGYRLLGEWQGYVLRQILQNGSWSPVKPSVIARNGAAITVSFDVQTPPIQADTVSLSLAPDYGFSFYDGTTQITINSIQFLTDTSIQLNLASIPTGNELYLKYVEGGANYLHGNIRDGSSVPSIYDDSSMHNWCVAFNRQVYLEGEGSILTIPDLVSWVNVGDGNWTTDGGGQIILLDQSPAGVDWSVAPGVTIGPTITAAALNGYPVLTFAGYGSGVGGLKRDTSDLPITTGAATFVVVSRRTTVAASREYSLGGNSRSDSFVMEYVNNTTQLAVIAGGGTTQLITQAQDQWDIWIGAYDNDNLLLRNYTKTNGLAFKAMNSVTTDQTIHMGQVGFGLGLKGDIAEALIFYRDLFAAGNEDYLNAVITYLSTKYAL